MKGDDLLLWCGGGLVATAAVAMLVFGLAGGESSAPGVAPAVAEPDEGKKSPPPSPTRPDRQPEPQPQPPEGGGEALKDKPASWVPSSSRESVSGDTLPASARASKHCEPSVNLIAVGKEMAVGFERTFREATAVPDSEERSIGARLEREVATSKEFRGKWDPAAEKDKYASYLNTLVAHLAKRRRRQALRYRVHIVRDKRFNAFALPGGVLAVHTGLLEGPDAVRDESELALVLSHEIAHVELRHTMAAYQYARVLLGDAATVGQLVTRMMTIPIQSKYEEEADRLGGRIAGFSGYNPMAGVTMWRRIALRSPPPARDPVGAILGTPTDVLGSHPPAHARCYLALTTAAALRPSLKAVRLYEGATSLRQRTPGFVRAH